MTPLKISEFAQVVQALNVPAEAEIQGFATDSDAAKPGDLFIAIRGARVDGHDFAESAAARGAVVALVERPVAVPYVLVDSVVDALARFAAHQRERFSGPVIGVTGSAGKTTTKEFLAAALAPLGPVLKTVGNRNTEFTSPLLWADLDRETRSVVVEMAMRGFGQIAHLARFTCPTIGVVTNIGYSHLQQVGSRQGIAQAKGELLEALPANGSAVLWREDEFFDDLSARTTATVRTFGFSPYSDCQVERYEPQGFVGSKIWGRCLGEAWSAELGFIGRHFAQNAAAAILCATLAGVPAQTAADQIKHAQLPPMRMEIRVVQGATVLLDNYNASPASMEAAIEALSEALVAGRKLAVIGEMRELGDESIPAHQSLGALLARSGFDYVLFIGEAIGPAFEEFQKHGGTGERAADRAAVSSFLSTLTPGDAVLIKGSRALELERALDPIGTAI